VNEFLEQFLIESRELIEQATDDLLALEQAPDDQNRIDSAFRAFHTLKGAAGIIEFALMGRLLHAAEDVLSAVRAGHRVATVDLVSACLSCLDQVAQWLDEIEATGELPKAIAPSIEGLMARFGADTAETPASPIEPAGSERSLQWLESLLALHPGTGAGAALHYTPDADCFFRGEDPLVLVQRIPGLLALRLSPARPWPELPALNPFSCNLVVDALFSTDGETIASYLRGVRDQVLLHPLEPHPVSTGLSDIARAILQAQIDLVLNAEGDGFVAKLRSAGRIVASILGQAALDGAPLVRSLEDSLAKADASIFANALRDLLAAASAKDESGTIRPAVHEVTARAIRVDVERIDAIINLAGELTVVKNALGHAVRLAREGKDARNLAQILKDQHALLERLTAELQRTALAIRVLPLRHVFQRFSRLVREMAASLGKSARLVVEGDATEADKVVVESLFEPLLHVIRNALSHGIEPGDARLRAGKAPTALIRLRGYREGESVIVEVSDDGRGIDLAQLRQVAAERGLLAPDALALAGDEEIRELIFMPGFSTASAVSDLSGRGVGMDAVRTAIERLGGRVSVRSQRGDGTTVQFVMPFTVTVTPVIVVEAAGQVFGVPFDAVGETLQLNSNAISRVGAAEAIVLHGRAVPLMSLAGMLGLPSPGERAEQIKALTTMVGGQLSALEVDGFDERLEVIVKPLGGLLTGLRCVAGTSLLGDGRVLIVLDLAELFG
jgi:two-component system, chemotaxis family, sensor kinase CheA